MEFDPGRAGVLARHFPGRSRCPGLNGGRDARPPRFRRSFTNFGAYLPAPAGAADLLTRRKGGQRRFAMKPDMSHFDRPAPIPPERFEDAAAALERLELIY